MSIPNYQQLQELSDSDLIDKYNAAATHTVVGTAFYLDELVRRQSARESARMTRLTRAMHRLTWAILGLTALNVAVVIFQIAKAA